jgi:sugar lactone lactonase YvrE
MRNALHLCIPLVLASALSAQTAYLIDNARDELFTVDLSTGAAAYVASTLNNSLTTPSDLTWDSATQTLWAVDFDGGEVGAIDPATGTFTPTFQTGQGFLQSMCWDPTTSRFYLSTQSITDLFVLDPATGTTTRVGPIGTGQGLIAALAVDAAGRLWAIDYWSGALMQIDKATAATTVVGTTRANITAMVFAPSGQLFGCATDDDSLYAIDTTNGTATLVGPHGANVQAPSGLAIATSAAFATAQPYGTGCGGGTASTFHEIFGLSPLFDLSNTGFAMRATADGYLVAPTSAAIVPPAGAPTPFLDDQTQRIALPFAFPFPGGVTNDIWLCSNGWISLLPTTATDLNESAAGLVGGTARICALWDDLNPASGGTIHAEVDPADPARFHVTFTGVPEYLNTGGNTFQVSLSASGTIEIKYGSCTVGDCLVGFSLGGGARDPGGIDISMAVQGSFTLGNDRVNLALDAVSRPRLGQAATVRTREIPANAALAFVLMGFAAQDPGFDLGPVGMSGCRLYTSSQASQPLAINGSTADFSLAIPNVPALAGRHFYLQGGAVAPGANPFGVILTNGMDWRLDTN